MKRILVVLATLATAGCTTAGFGESGGYPAYYGGGGYPAYYGGGGSSAYYGGGYGPQPVYYDRPGYAYGGRGPDWDEGHDYDRAGWAGAAQRQQAITAQQQQYNQQVSAAQQRYNQQVSANPRAAPVYRDQLARQAGAARQQLEQNTRDLRQ